MSLAVRDFNDYVLSLSPALYLPLGLGDISRRDENVGAATRPTINNSPQWQHDSRSGMYLLDPMSNGSISIAAGDGGETDVDTFTIFVALKARNTADLAVTTQRIVSKREAGGSSWELITQFAAGLDRITLLDSASAGLRVAETIEDARTVVVRATDGSPVEFFKNGVDVGSSAGNADLNTASHPIYIGSLFNGTLPVVGGGISCVVHFPSWLTPEQISDLHRTWEAIS